MTDPAQIRLESLDPADLAATEGALVVFTDGAGGLGQPAHEVDRAASGALLRATGDKGFKDKKGQVSVFAWPVGLTAKKVLLASLGDSPDVAAARDTGGKIAAKVGKGPITVAAGDLDADLLEALVLGLVLRLYEFEIYKKRDEDAEPEEFGPVTLLVDDPAAHEGLPETVRALASGVFFTRDLVNEPANILTTTEFANRIEGLAELGVEIRIIDEPELEAMGARALLAVGQGSDAPSKIAVMKWMKGGDRPPLALVGKGVVFDTGGISIKPAAGMEEMTMDMGGAAVVCGTMRALAMRNAPANVIAVVGLVENMPSGAAQRPGDIVRSMKGDTIEVANTDAEGRMVLADCLWFVQEEFKPAAIIDLATLTGAVIIALGHHHAGWYSTDDDLAAAFTEAARETGEPAWRMPLHEKYAEQNKSRLADVKNTGGRPAGSITAAEFLHRFVKDDVPWIHIDIAGVTLLSAANDRAPKGASGWGVAALDRLVRDRFES